MGSCKVLTLKAPAVLVLPRPCARKVMSFVLTLYITLADIACGAAESSLEALPSISRGNRKKILGKNPVWDLSLYKL